MRWRTGDSFTFQTPDIISFTTNTMLHTRSCERSSGGRSGYRYSLVAIDLPNALQEPIVRQQARFLRGFEFAIPIVASQFVDIQQQFHAPFELRLGEFTACIAFLQHRQRIAITR